MFSKKLLLLVVSFFALLTSNALAQQSITVGSVYATSGETVQIPVTVDDLTGDNIFGAEITIKYDTSVVTILGATSGSVIPAGALVQSNMNTDSTFIFAASATEVFVGEGTVVVFDALVKKFGETAIEIQSASFNDTAPSVTNGLVSTTIPVTFDNDAKVAYGKAFAVDIEVGADLAGRSISGYEFEVGFDETLVSFDSVEVAGTISEGLTVLANEETAGVVTVAYGDITELTGKGTLVTLYFTANEATAGVSPLSFDMVSFNDGAEAFVDTAMPTDATVEVDDYVGIYFSSLADQNIDEVSTLDIMATRLGEAADVFSYEFVLDYDESLVEVEVLTAGTVSEGMTVTSNDDGDKLTVAAFATAAISGDKLLSLRVTSVAAGTASFSFDSFMLNDGSPVADAATTSFMIMSNSLPTAPAIVAPAAGAEVTIEGDTLQTIMPTWSASTDAESDELNYTWQLSLTNDFAAEDVLVSVPTGADTSLTLTFKDVAAVLDANGVTVGDAVTLYHRAVVSDGTGSVAGTGASVVLTRGVLTNIDDDAALPTVFALEQNYPNPFNPTTAISFQIPQTGMVSLKVYDVMGREVATLVNSVRSAGAHNIEFDASKLSSGVYIYRLVSGNFTQTRKMTLMK